MLPYLKDQLYLPLLEVAVNHFWAVRAGQHAGRKVADTGNRSAVTGGKQLDGFVTMFRAIATAVGVPDAWIHDRSTTLPGFFRPSKNWDLIILSDQRELLAVLECKSQVGSFGNNFNNRTEEAIGSAVDLWTAFRENSFGEQTAPWLGYLMVLEDHAGSSRAVRVSEPHFTVREEFADTSYRDRYQLLCKKLVAERHYNAACTLMTKNVTTDLPTEASATIHAFVRSFVSNLISRV